MALEDVDHKTGREIQETQVQNQDWQRSRESSPQEVREWHKLEKVNFTTLSKIILRRFQLGH